MRIFKNRYYILRRHPGISGFVRWNEWEYSICTGRKAQGNSRLSVLKEFKAKGLGHFRLGNGHLPNYQPEVKEVEALRWLDANPFGKAFFTKNVEEYVIPRKY